MKHIVYDGHDVPPPVPMLDRRRGPAERRRVWRGGRRDSDWQDRPPGARVVWSEDQMKLSFLRRAMTILHLW